MDLIKSYKELKTEFKPFSIPFLNIDYQFRAYNTGEEKELMKVKALDDNIAIQNAVINLIEICSNVEDAKQYPKQVIAEMCKFLRSVSYSPEVKFNWTCGHCNHQNTNFSLNLDDEKFVDNKPRESKITIADGKIVIVLRHLTLRDEEYLTQFKYKGLPTNFKELKLSEKMNWKKQLKENDIDLVYSTLAMMIDCVITKEQNYDSLDLNEKKTFIEELSKKDFEVFAEGIQKFKYDPLILAKTCLCENPECKKETLIKLSSDLIGFFEF
jgi:hypothetical protein